MTPGDVSTYISTYVKEQTCKMKTLEYHRHRNVMQLCSFFFVMVAWRGEKEVKLHLLSSCSLDQMSAHKRELIRDEGSGEVSLFSVFSQWLLHNFSPSPPWDALSVFSGACLKEPGTTRLLFPPFPCWGCRCEDSVWQFLLHLQTFQPVSSLVWRI